MARKELARQLRRKRLPPPTKKMALQPIEEIKESDLADEEEDEDDEDDESTRRRKVQFEDP